MLPGFEFPASLPYDIAAVARFNGVRFAMDYFEAVIDKIVEKLSSFSTSAANTANRPSRTSSATPPPSYSSSHIPPTQTKTQVSTPFTSSTPSNTATQNASEGLIYRLSDDRKSYSVVWESGYKEKHIIIPSTYYGKPVTSVSGRPLNNEINNFVESVVIPEGVTSIESSAFRLSHALKSVTLPSTLKKIDKSAFVLCKSLTSITLPAGLKHIGEIAFGSCRSLTDCKFNGTKMQWRLIKKDVCKITKDKWHVGTPLKVIHCTDGDILL